VHWISCDGRYPDRQPRGATLLHKLIANAAHGINGTAIGGDMRIALPDNVEFLQCVVAPISPDLSARWISPPDRGVLPSSSPGPASCDCRPDGSLSCMD
jgi:hypothetical protein